MSPPAQRLAAVRFGDFVLDLQTGELQRNGQKTQLQPKVLEVLATLLESPGAVVTREQLHHRLWSADTFVEFDDSLNHAIKKVREVLSDSADHPRFVETLPRHGYRFVASVEPLAASRSETQTRTAGLSARYRWPIAALLMIVAAAGYILWSHAQRSQTPGRRIMLAVLPLDNLTGSEDQEYLSDGLTEEIITEMGRMSPDHLGVIARTSTLQYKKTKKTVAEIGRELGVDYVMEGSLRRSSPQVRLTLQLIRVNDQTHLWAQAYDLSTADITSLQQDVAQRMARILAIEVPPEVQARLAGTRTVNPEARQAYLQGRYWLTRGSGFAATKARDYMENAISLEPTYADAYASLSLAYIFLGSYGILPQLEAIPKAKAAARKALELDTSVVDAHLALAGIMAEYEWDFAGAAKEYQQAIRNSPNSAAAHQWYSALLSETGRFEEAILEIKKAYELDPVSLRVGVDLGRAYYWARHYDQAVEKYRKVLELDPNYSGAHSMLGLALLQKREYDEGIAELQKGVALLPGNKTGYSLWLGYAYAVAGRDADARKMLAIQFEQRAQRHVAANAIALTYLGMGDKDNTFAWLETAYREHDGMATLKAYPLWDPVRSDSRFQDLLRRVGLPPDLLR